MEIHSGTAQFLEFKKKNPVLAVWGSIEKCYSPTNPSQIVKIKL